MQKSTLSCRQRAIFIRTVVFRRSKSTEKPSIAVIPAISDEFNDNLFTFYALIVRKIWCILNWMEGGVAMPDTTKLNPLPEGHETASDILAHVYRALQAKGYDPITQLVGFIMTGDPTYITSYNNARSLVCRLERDEILEEIVRFYVAKNFDS